MHYRSALLWLTVLVVCVFLPAAQSEPSASDYDRALHVLNRLTYGPRPGDVQAVASMGVEHFISRQLHPETLGVPRSLAELTSAKPSLTLTPAELFMQFGRPALTALANQGGSGADSRKEAQKLIAQTYRKIYLDQCEVRVNRALDSPRQLEELMTDFWFNHFNVSFDKGLDHLWVGSYEEVAIRPYVLGKFRDLLGATAHHAAMLFYLDNWQNSKPNGEENGPRKRFKGLNENYARELMELHTLGVDGGYTQTDVIALAKILTGLGLESRREMIRGGGLGNRYGDHFDSNRHDFSDKVLLGKTIKGSGALEIEQALDILASHPSTAHHISYQLAQYFVSDTPPPALVDRLSRKFLAADGDIRSVLSELFSSPEFWDKKYEGSKFKSPYRFVISAMRASNTDAANVMPIVAFLRQQGMPLYQCLTPDGYKNTREAWLNSDALVNRLNFATALGLGRLPDLRPDFRSYEELKPIVGRSPSASTLNAVEQAPAQLKACLVLGSPEFMKY